RRVRELEQGVTAPVLVGGRAVPLSPGTSETEEPCTVWMGRGQALLQLGRAREALECFDRALAEDARHVEALLKRGLALERLNRLDEARQSYERAAELAPDQPRPWLCQAGVLNQQERFAEALACYERALHVRERGAGKSA
ncbi:MAG TPA: tetratricopeptide repeat protein, partial [Methylomirabilota bacterium]|nr:tetratricopeptide repeat protein [Methylomirabilota bacterium]